MMKRGAASQYRASRAVRAEPIGASSVRVGRRGVMTPGLVGPARDDTDRTHLRCDAMAATGEPPLADDMYLVEGGPL